jgi:hypothetical protein
VELKVSWRVSPKDRRSCDRTSERVGSCWAACRVSRSAGFFFNAATLAAPGGVGLPRDSARAQGASTGSDRRSPRHKSNFTKTLAVANVSRRPMSTEVLI